MRLEVVVRWAVLVLTVEWASGAPVSQRNVRQRENAMLKEVLCYIKGTPTTNCLHDPDIINLMDKIVDGSISSSPYRSDSPEGRVRLAEALPAAKREAFFSDW